MATMKLSVTVNGEQVEHLIEPRLLLSDFLREKLALTGTHVGCEHGVCGACTVIFNGRTVRSCLVFAVQTNGGAIETVEGLARSLENLHPLQRSFWERHGLQCGYCTPGMLMTALELLRNHPRPSREEIREAISGNLCRCTGYETIIDAVHDAAQVLAGSKA